MVSRGEVETETLRQRVEYRLQGLCTQLRDLEENREVLDEDEYSYLKETTIEQLKECERQVELHQSGDMTLVDHISQIQLTIQHAVSEAFKTPEVLQMFADKQPQQLRSRLEDLEREQQLARVGQTEYNAKKLEILLALNKLGQPLAGDETEFIIALSSAGSRVEAPQDKDVDAASLLSHAKETLQEL